MDPELVISAAAANGKVDKIRELLEKDAGLAKCYDPDGWTPLHVASHFGHPEVAKVLLEAGADPVAKSTNVYENQPIHTAAVGKNPDLIQLLLDWGADPDASEADGRTALHRAAEHGDVATTQVLLNGGANPDAADESGKSVFVVALERGYEDVIQLLRAFDERRGG